VCVCGVGGQNGCECGRGWAWVEVAGLGMRVVARRWVGGARVACGYEPDL